MKLFLVLIALAVSQVKVPAPDSAHAAKSQPTLADSFVITEVVAPPADVKPIAPVKPIKVEVDPLPLSQPKIVTVADAPAATCKAGGCANGSCSVAGACGKSNCGDGDSCAEAGRSGPLQKALRAAGHGQDGPIRRLFRGGRRGGGRLFGGRCGVGGCG